MEESAAPAAPAPRSIGERLRAGRERAGLSVPATAEKLHLDVKVIEALEADRFAEIGASVYVRGHLRRYADFVGEPGVELVQAYLARQAQPPPPDLTQVPHAERRADPRRLISPLVGLGCALVLAVAIWWVLGSAKSGHPASAAATDAPAGSWQADSAQPVNPAIAAKVTPALHVAEAAPGAKPSPGVDGAAAAADAPPKRDEPPPARNIRLTLELNGESWVEVYDSTGTRLFYDVASANSVQSIEGRPPLRVILGNAAAVAVQVDGQAREIPASAVNGEGARFVVNRSGSLARSRQ
ncbi:MAG TPA: RodZ domain-containing protein [Steroidobacteraceae bacterium]|nr:RodZ domain-containing protein [Steroidobacteraceae bacterium]